MIIENAKIATVLLARIVCSIAGVFEYIILLFRYVHAHHTK